MNQDQIEIPIQPVEQPHLCNPYEEPDAHWVYDTETGEAMQATGQTRCRILVQNAADRQRTTSNAVHSGGAAG